jgi:hypothetical protein
MRFLVHILGWLFIATALVSLVKVLVIAWHHPRQTMFRKLEVALFKFALLVVFGLAALGSLLVWLSWPVP